MPEINYTNYHNSEMVHYVDQTEDPCHGAMVAGNWIQDETGILRADLIQQDTVPATPRSDVNYDPETFAANTWHYYGCQRDFPEGG